jgi:hypothetical protein
MFDSTETTGISNEHAIQRMFELVRDGQTDGSEYALLDAVIQARLRQTYDETGADEAPRAAA